MLFNSCLKSSNMFQQELKSSSISYVDEKINLISFFNYL
jgi:hypothetical protein